MKKSLIGLFSVLGLGLSLAACESAAPPETPKGKKSKPTPVVLAEVRLEAEQQRLEAVGTSRALKSVILYPAVAGEVVAVKFRAGQTVAANAPLLELDKRDETLAVKLAQVRLEEASLLYRRYQRTEGSQAVSPTLIDEARAAMESARLELARAEVALADRTLKAPFAGVVGLTDIDPGDRVTPATEIASLDDREVLLVNFAVPEIFMREIQPGQTISLQPWHRNAPAYQGEVVEISSRIDPRSRVFQVRAKVDNRDDRLRPGMSFRVTLVLEGQYYPAVPEVAVLWGGDGAYVWAVENGQATRIPVTIVQRREGRVLVEAALQAGDRVVEEGIQRMREGLAVGEFKAEP